METATDDLKLTAGQSVHHYTVLRELGHGAVANVFLARDTRLERLVALKLLRRLDSERAQRFLAEARITAQCSHDNIAVIHDVNEYKGQPYLALEYLRGHNLRREIIASRRGQAKGPLAAMTPERTVRIMLPVVRALDHAHQAGIVHKNLNPETIFVTRAGAIKVLNLGIAEALGQNPALAGLEAVRALQGSDPDEGTAAALAYLAPEQWRGEDVDHRADLWAVGIMLYEMVAGAHPLAPITQSTLRRVADLDEPMPRLGQARDDLDDYGAALATIIERCLAKKPADRIAGAGELITALSALDSSHTGAGNTAQPGTETRRATRSLGRLWGVPRLPRHHLQPAELARLIEALVDDRSHTMGVHGPGGTGKSTLAAAALAATRLRERFDHGIFWLPLGHEPDIVHLQRRLARALGDADHGIFDPVAGKQRLGELLAGKRVLVVLDDVRDMDHMSHLDAVAETGRLLVTTRDRDMLARAGAAQLGVQAFSREQSLALLAAWQGTRPEDLPPEAEDVARACAHLPLALALIGAQLGQGQITWPQMLALLEQAGNSNTAQDAAAQDAKTAGYHHVLTAIEVSVNALDSVTHVPEARQCYVDLAVFPPDVPITSAMLHVLWSRRGLDQGQSNALMTTLVDHALAAWAHDGHEPDEAILLHDLPRSYIRERAREQTGTGDFGALHGALVDALAAECEHGLARGPRRDMPAFYTCLPYHLERAGRREELAQLLGNLDWLQGKLATAGVAELLDDFEHLGLEHLAGAHSDLGLLRDALRLSSQVLAVDPGQLPGQLIGRLADWDSEAPIAGLLAQTRAMRAASWLCPRAPALMVPGGALLFTRMIPSASVGPVAVTPQGTRALFVSGGHGLELWDLGQGKPLCSLRGHSDWIHALAVSPDGTRAITASADRTCKIWNLDSGALVHTLTGHEGEVTAVAVTGRGERAITAAIDGTIRIWDMHKGRELAVLPGADVRIHAVAVAPGSAGGAARLVCAQADRLVVIRDLDTGEVYGELVGHADEVTAVAVTHDGTRIISGSRDGLIMLWDLPGEAALRVLTGHNAEITAVAVTPDDARFVSASADKSVRIWPLEGRAGPRILHGHTRAVTGLAMATHTDRAVSVARDRTLRAWDVRSPRAAPARTIHTSEITALAGSGDRVVSAAEDERLLLWDAQNSAQPRVLGTRPAMVTVLAPTTSARMAAGREDGALEIWNLDTCKHELIHAHSLEITAIAAAGTRMATASCDRTVKIWDLDSGAPVRTLAGHHSIVQAVAFIPGSTRLVSASYDKTLRIWDLASGMSLSVLSGHDSVINTVVVSPDGSRAVSASSDATVRIWDLGARRREHTLSGHMAEVWAAAITPDGTRIISVSSDSTVKIWNLATGELIHTLYGHTGEIVAVTVMPGDIALTASHDRTVRAWNIVTGEHLAAFTGESAMSACASAGEAMIAGDESGRVYFLDLVRGPS